jgi:hypothetical protein
VCCFPHERLVQMIGERRRQSEQDEDQYIVLVTAEPHHQLRVYMNAPGQRRSYLENPTLVARADFPRVLFAS